MSDYDHKHIVATLETAHRYITYSGINVALKTKTLSQEKILLDIEESLRCLGASTDNVYSVTDQKLDLENGEYF